MFKKWFDKLYGPALPVELILFNIITTIGLVGGIVSFIVSVVAGLPMIQNVIVAASIAGLYFCFLLANKKGRIELASNLVIIGITLILLPPMFFTGGGYHSGMPLWFLIGMIFTFLLVKGKLCWVLLGIQSIIYTACFYAAYLHPEWVNMFPSEEGTFTDILQSMFIAVFTIGLVVRFQIDLYVRVLKEREEQNELLIKTREAADKANEAKTRFLSNMSHDIRTPINGILGMLDIAEQNSEDPQKQKDCIEKIRGASNHLLSLVNDVLDISALEAGKIELSTETFDVRTLLDNCTSIIRLKAEESGIELVSEQGEIPEPYLVGSPLHVRRIIINILGNAVKYNRNNGRIHMYAKEILKDPGHAEMVFIIQDTGIGMSKEFMEHIFEPFTQADHGARSKFNGTGLGMAITKNLVDCLQGTITLESKENVGTTFEVHIPFAIGRKEDIPVNDKSRSIRLNQKKILLVEDNELNREVAHYMLANAGAEVIETVDGQQAVEQFRQSREGEYDCILMDIMMPVMNGLDAAKEIRSLPRKDAGTVPIIAMTANAYSEDIKKTLASGMNAHLSKPIDSAEMLYTVAECIKGSKK